MFKNKFCIIGLLCLLVVSCKTIETPSDPQVELDRQYQSNLQKLLKDRGSVSFDDMYYSYLDSSFLLQNNQLFSEFETLEIEIASGMKSCSDIDFIDQIRKLFFTIRVHVLAADCAQKTNSKLQTLHEELIDYIIAGHFEKNDGTGNHNAIKTMDLGEPEDIVALLGYTQLEGTATPYANGTLFSYIITAEQSDGTQREFYFTNWEALERIFAKSEDPFDIYSLEFDLEELFDSFSEDNPAFEYAYAIQNWNTKNDEAIKRLISAAQRGNASAQEFLAVQLQKGKDIAGYTKDDAVDLLLSSAEIGIASAIARLAFMFEEGVGVEKDHDTALQLRQKAIKKVGEAEVDYKYYGFYKTYEVSPSKALPVLIKSANRGHPEAARVLALHYFDEGENQKAHQYLDKAIDAHDADAGVLKAVHLLKDNDNNYNKIKDEFFRLLNESAQLNSPHAHALLYKAYANEEKINKEKYVYHLLKAASLGDVDSQYTLARRLHEGELVAKDHYEANRWLNLAIKSNHLPSLILLGVSYEKGRGVPEDKAVALNLYKIAAEEGYPSGMFNYGYMYLKGKGVEKDYPLAIEWITKASEKGLAIADNELGLLYLRGEYFEQNKALAVTYFLKAAEGGEKVAMYNLGLAYEKGHGVEVDTEKAKEWFRKAMSAGHGGATLRLVQLGNSK